MRVLLSLASLLAAAAILAGCAQSPSTARTPEPESAAAAQAQQAPVSTVAPSGPVLGTVEVWLAEHGILLWTPALSTAGTYEFEIENRGLEAHDFTIVRAARIQDIPTRSGRALLQDIEVIARSPVVQPEATVTMLANLDRSGSYVVLSSRGQDFGRGMASVIAVGRPAGERAEPQATPPPDDNETVAAYLVDRAIFVHDREVTAGPIEFRVQNLGPSPHDLVVIQWRGAPDALPVDDRGNVLVDGLIVVGRLPALPAGEAATLEVEVEEEFAYVAFSSLDGDYDAGMAVQIVPR